MLNHLVSVIWLVCDKTRIEQILLTNWNNLLAYRSRNSWLKGWRTQHSTERVWLCLKEFENPTITGFWICFWGKLEQRSHMIIIIASSITKSSVFNFSSTRRRKAGDIFKFLCFEERFQKALFYWRIRVDDKPDRRNKAVCSSFSGVDSKHAVKFRSIQSPDGHKNWPFTKSNTLCLLPIISCDSYASVHKTVNQRKARV